MLATIVHLLFCNACVRASIARNSTGLNTRERYTEMAINCYTVPIISKIPIITIKYRNTVHCYHTVVLDVLQNAVAIVIYIHVIILILYRY